MRLYGENCDRYRQELETVYSSLEEKYASQTATLTASLTTMEATCRGKRGRASGLPCHGERSRT